MTSISSSPSGSDTVVIPDALEALAQSVLAEAVRNAHKHAAPTKVEVSLRTQDDTLTLDVVNDGVRGARAAVRHGPQARGARGAAVRRDRGVRRAGAREMASQIGGAA